jgi:cytoskeletal protein RodZ
MVMDSFEYDHVLLKETRLKKRISAQSIAADLCLAERQIISIEENSAHYFPSKCLKYAALKKYILALELTLEEVIYNFNELDPTPSLLKKK